MTNISKRHNDEELIEILKEEVKEYGYNEDESKVIVDFATRNRTFDIAKIALNYLYGSNTVFYDQTVGKMKIWTRCIGVITIPIRWVDIETDATVARKIYEVCKAVREAIVMNFVDMEIKSGVSEHIKKRYEDYAIVDTTKSKYLIDEEGYKKLGQAIVSCFKDVDFDNVPSCVSKARVVNFIKESFMDNYSIAFV